jgi:hypothetical protein
MARPQPRIAQILKNDFLALLLLLAPVVTWGIYVAKASGVLSKPGRAATDSGPSPVFLAIAVGLTLLCLTILILRIRGMQRLFATGKVVTGRITSIYFADDRGRVEYSYSLGGQQRSGGMALHKTKATAALAEGQEVEILVDPDKPDRSLIARLYS